MHTDFFHPMASMLSAKTNHLRYVARILRNHGRPTLLSPPFSYHLYDCSTHPHLVRNQGYGNGYLMLHQRLLSGTNASNANEKNLAQGTSEKGDSSEGRESGSERDQKSDAGKSVRGSPVSWLSFLLLVVTGVGKVVYYDWEKKRHIEVKQEPSEGKAAIGGPFHLINDDGKYITKKDFMGKWTLLYFGFTHCPDICLEELVKLVATVDKIKAKAEIKIVPFFITVDPERDTVKQVWEYVKEFHPSLIGLTGTPEEI